MPRPPPSPPPFPSPTLSRSLERRRPLEPGEPDHRDGHARQHARFAGAGQALRLMVEVDEQRDRKSTRLNSSHPSISYAVFCLKKKKTNASLPPHYPAHVRTA